MHSMNNGNGPNANSGPTGNSWRGGCEFAMRPVTRWDCLEGRDPE